MVVGEEAAAAAEEDEEVEERRWWQGRRRNEEAVVVEEEEDVEVGENFFFTLMVRKMCTTHCVAAWEGATKLVRAAVVGGGL